MWRENLQTGHNCFTFQPTSHAHIHIPHEFANFEVFIMVWLQMPFFWVETIHCCVNIYRCIIISQTNGILIS
jgi:hypothetical protein